MAEGEEGDFHTGAKFGGLFIAAEVVDNSVGAMGFPHCFLAPVPQQQPPFLSWTIGAFY